MIGECFSHVPKLQIGHYDYSCMTRCRRYVQYLVNKDRDWLECNWVCTGTPPYKQPDQLPPGPKWRDGGDGGLMRGGDGGGPMAGKGGGGKDGL